MWYPNVRAAGIAGILAGVALAGEFVFFGLSSFNQSTFNDPSTALPFLRDHGVYVRVAVLFGATGIVLTLVFLAGLAAVLPGASGPGVDAAARDRIEAAGFGDAFGHGLGHGIGLLVHEDPRLAQESRHTLAVGNVVTVEPGIYLPGLGGIRIEDLVVVQEGEPEILTTFTKDLLTVD